MLAYSLETAFFLALFGLVPSAIALAAVVAVRVWEPPRPPAHPALGLGFLSLVLAYGLRAAFYGFAVTPGGLVDVTRAWWFVLAEVLQLAAALLLGSAFLHTTGARRGLPLFVTSSLVLAVPGLWRLAADSTAVLTTIDPATAPRLAAAVAFAMAGGLLATVAPLPAVAFVVMALGRGAFIVGIASPPLAEFAWGAGSVLGLVGLLLLASSLERLSQRRLLHYVLRFNLTFLALAFSLIVVLAQISRRQFEEFSAQQVQDVAELARGQMLTALDRGEPAQGFLDRQDVTTGLVRDFGRYPELRRIVLEFQGHSMGLAINDAGEIDQQFWTGQRTALTPVAPGDFMEATLLETPVVWGGRQVGRIEIRHSVINLNARIGQQMRVAFGVFTLFVLVGSVVTGILVLVADETIHRQDRELAEAQRRLISSERLASVGAVADAVAHEVNNPAGILIARSDYLTSVIRGRPWSGEIQDDIDTIRRQAQRIAKTVQDLLTSTRRARQAREPVDLGAVVQSSILLVRPLAQGRDVRFENSVEGDRFLVWGDYSRLEQVFVNLLLNAAQAIPGRGTVAVTASVRPGGAWVDVEVADTGAGISPDHMHRIFERFFTTKDPGTGSGLGLSIVAGIVREHGGHIDVESQLGRGTRFRVTLQACTPHWEHRAELVHPMPAPTDPQARLTDDV